MKTKNFQDLYIWLKILFPWVLLRSAQLVMLSNALLLNFFISLTARGTNDEVVQASSVFCCQEALFLPSRVSFTEEIFIKWEVHQGKHRAIVSDSRTNSLKILSYSGTVSLRRPCAPFGGALRKLWWHPSAISSEGALGILPFHSKINCMTQTWLWNCLPMSAHKMSQ